MGENEEKARFFVPGHVNVTTSLATMAPSSALPTVSDNFPVYLRRSAWNLPSRMVTESSTATKSKATTRNKPKPVHSWTNSDVQKWYRRCGNNPQYADLFQKHDITGLTLLRMTDNALLRMGIENNKDREAIWREILKQKLKADIMEIRDLERDGQCPE